MGIFLGYGAIFSLFSFIKARLGGVLGLGCCTTCIILMRLATRSDLRIVQIVVSLLHRYTDLYTYLGRGAKSVGCIQINQN